MYLEGLTYRWNCLHSDRVGWYKRYIYYAVSSISLDTLYFLFLYTFYFITCRIFLSSPQYSPQIPLSWIFPSLNRLWKYSRTPLSFRRMNLWSSSLRTHDPFARRGQFSFRSFLLDPSRRTIGLEGNQKDETPSFANSDCVARLYRSYIRGCRCARAPLFPTFRFLCSSTRGGKIHKGWEKWARGRKNETNRTFPRFSTGVWQHVVGCRNTLVHPPPVSRPLRDITVLWPVLHSGVMIASYARFQESTV